MAMAMISSLGEGDWMEETPEVLTHDGWKPEEFFNVFDTGGQFLCMIEGLEEAKKHVLLDHKVTPAPWMQGAGNQDIPPEIRREILPNHRAVAALKAIEKAGR